MMSKRGTEKNLEKIGIDMNSNVMMVFKAILLAAGGFSNYITYREIETQLKVLDRKKYTKAYLYRLLSELEDGEFITVDPIQHPKQFTITKIGLIKAIEKKRNKILSILLSNRQDLTTKYNLLKIINPQDLAITAYNQLVGIAPIEGSVIIEGIENVRTTVIREFVDLAKAGDIIRVLAPGSLLDGGLKKSGLAEQKLMAKSRDGVKITSVLLPQKHQEFTTDLIIKYLKNIGDSFRALAATGNISLKIAKDFTPTYRMVSLNNEKMLLYLTHSAESDVAALIHRQDNPGLIDDAVNTFDTLFKEGMSVIEIVEQMITSKKSS
ncbi:hypothetical protein EU527_05135 [Candidatus Thorarchaeota archaeon]|nr:MAG: hypothetical protein EU527_05135 [Candidatus Thorarchaeota archaeon]